MKASNKTGVAMVFIAATLMATNVAANDGETGLPDEQSERAEFDAQADFIGLKVYNVNASDFSAGDHADTWNLLGDSGRCARFSGFAYAPVEIPHGSEVIGVSFTANDSTATGDVAVALRKFEIANDALATNLFSGSTGSAATPGYGTFSASNLGGDNTLNKLTHDLFVVADVQEETSALRVCNVAITYIPPLSGGLEFHGIDPCAIFDTRSGTGDFNGKLGNNEVVTVDAIMSNYSAQGGFAGSCGIASAGGFLADGELTTKAIAINLVALDPNGSGNLKAWANNVSEPPGGVVVYEPGISNSNEFALNVEGGVSCPGILCVTNGGLFKVKNNSSSSVHVRGVVVGYFTQVDSNQ